MNNVNHPEHYAAEQKVMKGFKVFEPDWTCRGFQYTCPGTFEEDVTPSVCDRGFHFCVKAADCFKYYRFNHDNKVAEVIALGDVDSDETKSCTNKIQIVREIPWAELLEIVNAGKGCYGFYNIGDHNRGNFNVGSYNDGNFNIGNRNVGSSNVGYYNVGHYNVGDFNVGDFNVGYWNKTSFSAGCFCTKEPNILLFNKPSNWTMRDWLNSEARCILNNLLSYGCVIKYVYSRDMTEQEKAAHPEAETTGGYLKIMYKPERCQSWWNDLSNFEKAIVKAIPNFDKAIFKEITGIDVDL